MITRFMELDRPTKIIMVFIGFVLALTPVALRNADDILEFFWGSSSPEAVVTEIDEDSLYTSPNDTLLYNPANHRGLAPAEMSVDTEAERPTAFEQFLVRTDQIEAVKVDEPVPAITYQVLAEEPNTVVVGGLKFELPDGYSQVLEDAVTPDGAIEIYGRDEDFGTLNGAELRPILRLGTVGFGVSNWADTSACELVNILEDKDMELILKRETLVGLQQYDCDGVSFMRAYAEVYEKHPGGIQFWAEYFAQTDRVPDEFVPMLGTATLVAP